MKERKYIQDLAMKRIMELFSMAEEQCCTDPYLSARYIKIMEKISMRMDITLPMDIKRNYCKACKLPYQNNSRIRLSRRTLRVTCLNCGSVRILPYFSR